MALTDCIIHHLCRREPAGQTELTLRPQTNPTEGASLSLFEQLRHSFRRAAKKQFGRFDDQRSDCPWPGLVQKLQRDGISFVQFSHTLAKELEQQLAQQQDPQDVFLLFARESLADKEVVSVFVYQQLYGLQMSDELTVQPNEHVDPSKLLAGVSVNLNEATLDDANRYLSLHVVRGEKTLLDMMRQFVGFTAGADTVAETAVLLDAVDRYAAMGPIENIEQTREQIVDFCLERNMAGEPVAIEELSQVANEAAPHEFAQFFAQQLPEPMQRVHTDRASLKRYGRIAGRDKDISLSFSAAAIGDAVEFDPQAGTLLIRRLPKGLKEQLVQLGEQE